MRGDKCAALLWIIKKEEEEIVTQKKRSMPMPKPNSGVGFLYSAHGFV
jgi:hypothetical protein